VTPARVVEAEVTPRPVATAAVVTAESAAPEPKAEPAPPKREAAADKPAAQRPKPAAQQPKEPSPPVKREVRAESSGGLARLEEAISKLDSAPTEDERARLSNEIIASLRARAANLSGEDKERFRERFGATFVVPKPRPAKLWEALQYLKELGASE
jgi:hypothetical protein